MVVRALPLLLATVLAGVSCAGPAPSAPRLPSISLIGPGGAPVDLPRATPGARLTVVVFFSPHCHCLDQHEPRLRALYAEVHPKGVELLMIDSEVGASRERDDFEASKRAYPFPILTDRGAKLADLLGARYATYSVVVDGDGRIRYRGGIDDDKTHLHDDARAYLKDAIDDLLAGRAPRVAEGKALGCALERW